MAYLYECPVYSICCCTLTGRYTLILSFHQRRRVGLFYCLILYGAGATYITRHCAVHKALHTGICKQNHPHKLMQYMAKSRIQYTDRMWLSTVVCVVAIDQGAVAMWIVRVWFPGFESWPGMPKRYFCARETAMKILKKILRI